MTKNILVIVAVLMFCFTAGLSWSLSRPTEKVIQETQNKYSQRGQFAYTGYAVSVQDRPSQVLFPPIIENMKMLFTCSNINTIDVRMKIVLEDKAGTWQKEIPVSLLSGPVASFALDLKGLLALGDTISGELAEKATGYNIKIVADVGAVNNPFEVILAGELNSNSLIWDETGFIKTARGYPGVSNPVWGSFGYIAQIKNNSLYGPATLERPPAVPAFQPANTDSALFLTLVKSLDIQYSYSLLSDAKIDSSSGEYSVDLVFSEADRWSRTFHVISTTPITGAFNFTVPLDTARLKEIAAQIDQEIGGRGAVSQNIDLVVTVHNTAVTAAGTVNETFTQELKGTMSDKIVWNPTKSGKEDLTLVVPGAITKPVTVNSGFILFLRILSSVGLGFTLVVFLVLGYSYLRTKRSGPTIIEQRFNNKKKYGQLISEISDLPALREDEIIISVPSLEDLANISNNSLNPILLKVESDRLDYIVIVGLKRYIYSTS